MLFLGTILAVVLYLTKTKKDRTELVYHGEDAPTSADSTA